MEQLAYDDPQFLADLHLWAQEYMPRRVEIIKLRQQGISWSKIGQEVGYTNEWARQCFLGTIKERDFWLKHGRVRKRWERVA